MNLTKDEMIKIKYFGDAPRKIKPREQRTY